MPSVAPAVPVAAARTQTLPMAPTPGVQAGQMPPLGGGLHLRANLKELLLFGAAGAVLGMLVPVIPGGPVGGAAIGAAIALLL